MAIPRLDPDPRSRRASPLARPSFASKLVRLAAVLLLGATSAWLGTCVWRSRGWPVINDASLFHYVALRISQGAVPYREIFDFQFPGTLLVHLAVIETLGPGDAAWRAFDLALLAVTIAVIWAFLHPFGKVAAWAGAVLYTTWHLGLGAWNTGQRDFVMGPLLLGSALVIARAIESGVVARRLLLAGLCAGAAATIKPQAIVFALLLVPFVLAAGGRQRIRALATFLAGCLIAPAGAAAWLVSSGGAPAFLEIVREYLLVLHLEMERMPLATLLHDWLTNRFVVPIYAAGVLGFWISHSRGERGPRRLLLVTGFGYGIFHIAIQQKGWVYHFYPAALFGCAWLASALSIFEPLPQDRGRDASELPRPLGATARFLTELTVVLLVARPLTVLAPRVEANLGNTQRTLHIQNAVAELEGELGRLVPAGGKAQVLDAGLIGLEALLHMGIAQPTRHTYAHPLYVSDTAEYTTRLRAEFLADIERDPPHAFVVFGFAPKTGTNGLLERFPELGAHLDARWKVAVVHPEYRIFVPAPD